MHHPFTAIVVSLFACVSAASAESLTWNGAVAEALVHSPALAAEREAVHAASSGVTVATSGFLPDLSVSGDLGRSGSQKLDRAWGPVGPSSVSSDYRFGGSASWSVFEGGATWAGRRQAVAGLARARAAYRQTSRRLRVNLRQMFDRLLYAQRNVELLAVIKERLNRDARYLEIQFRSGREPRWTFLKAQADEAGMSWQTGQARLDIAIQQHALAQLLGRDPDSATALIASGDLDRPAPPLDVRPLHPVLERQHPDLLAQSAAVDASAASLWRSRSSWLPSVRASAGLGWSDGTVWPPDRSAWNAGLSVSLPIFSGGADAAAINQARHAWIGSRHTLDDTRAAVRSALFAAWAGYRSQFDHQPVFRADADAATERFRTVQGLYEAGKSSYLEFEQAGGSLTQTQQRLLSGRLDLAQAETQFMNALGRTLEDEGDKSP